ncbi:MAG TPA: glycosyl hydrolase, partial [Gemmatimonadales bacterium]
MVARSIRAAALLALAAFPLTAQTAPASPPDTSLYRTLQWRNIGPFRGGRSVAVAGVPSQPNTFYAGYTGGGLWKTEDRGEIWRNVSDGFFKTGSVGAITVARSDANVIYAGMGEHAIRGVATHHGNGVYRSTDAGKTWTHVGLEKTRQISRIRVHPSNPDLVYVAAQGAIYAPTPDRGIYRSKDGGKTWERVHFVSDSAGASDLAMDPTNPRILYAAYWDHQRTPWQVRSGGAGSGIYKSSDGGDTWTRLGGEEGGKLPKLMGKIGVDVSPVDPNVVWAIVEAEDGGVYRSEDAGKTWRRTSEDRLIRARAWYYTEVYADPRDRETVYVLNAPLTRSIDGGRTFQEIQVPHGDTHDLWINPADSRVMILADDGGATITINGGRSWSTQENQPTAQFYRVNTDNRFPYWVYGGQQDNSSVAIMSRNPAGFGIGWKNWFDAAGCESAYLAFNPDDPRYLYGGCYQGSIGEMDTRTGYQRDIMAYPSQNLAVDPKSQKYRFNWNAPLIVSKHDPSVIYHASNVLLRSSDRGNTWTEVSPDLTRNE